MPKTKVGRKAKATPKAVREILDAALRQPGVADVMQVLGEWRQLDEMAQQHRELAWPEPVSWLSDSTSGR